MEKLNRRKFLGIMAGTAAAALRLPGCGGKPAGKRPNILFIFSDQQHWQAAGFKDKFFDTPGMDLFAKNSVVFENAFCTTPQCSPSRSSIMTGLYPSKTGVMGNMHNAGGDPLQMPTIGKWHLGEEKIATAGWNQEFLLHEGIDLNEENDSRVTDKAAKFLAENSNSQKPFALYLSYNNPHDIYFVERAPNIKIRPEIVLPASLADDQGERYE